MKWIVSLFAGSILFLGCSSKPNDLTFSLYQPKVSSKIRSVSIQKVYIKSVIDLRPNTRAIGTFESGNDLYLVETKTNLNVWFYDAIERGLKERGYKIIPDYKKGSIYIKVYITKATADYKQIKNSDDMFGKLKLKIEYKKGNLTQTDDIYISQSGYYGSLPDKEEYEEFVQRMLDKSVDKIVRKVSVY